MGVVHKNLIGEIKENINGLKYKIIEILPNGRRKIKFIDSGYEKVVGCKEISNGHIKDNISQVWKPNDNLIGNKYGKWIIKSFDKRKNGKPYWNCKCECGNIVSVEESSLKNGLSTQCKKCSSKNNRKDEKYINKVFGRLTVLERDLSSKDRTKYICLCECGNKISVLSTNLLDGSTKSCGCLKEEKSNIFNKKFGRLEALYPIDKDKNGVYKWLCLCDCGNTHIARISDLKSGKILSCGCYSKEVKSKNNLKHGGKTKTPERLYTIWGAMKQRCYYTKGKSYKDYGGRGIRICDEWLFDYTTFRSWALNNGYKDNLSIDRIDVNGDYEPNNCRWATSKQQANNTRRNVVFEYNGVKHTMSEWSEILNINYSTLRAYIQQNGVEDINIFIKSYIDEVE